MTIRIRQIFNNMTIRKKTNIKKKKKLNRKRITNTEIFFYLNGIVIMNC
jgi:hypothetical protein